MMLKFSGRVLLLTVLVVVVFPVGPRGLGDGIDLVGHHRRLRRRPPVEEHGRLGHETAVHHGPDVDNHRNVVRKVEENLDLKFN